MYLANATQRIAPSSSALAASTWKLQPRRAFPLPPFFPKAWALDREHATFAESTPAPPSLNAAWLVSTHLPCRQPFTLPLRLARCTKSILDVPNAACPPQPLPSFASIGTCLHFAMRFTSPQTGDRTEHCRLLSSTPRLPPPRMGPQQWEQHTYLPTYRYPVIYSTLELAATARCPGHTRLTDG